MHVYCSRCKLGDTKGSRCLRCQVPFQYRCAYCGSYLTDMGQCLCIRVCKTCKQEHSSRKACTFSVHKGFGGALDKDWRGSQTVGLGYPKISESLPGASVRYSTFPFLKSVEEPKPIAKCSFHYRYHSNRGQGALKYDPVSCSQIHDEASCQLLRELRGWGELSFQFCCAIEPGCKDLKHKLMVVPSVGCPKALGNEVLTRTLLWAMEASTRPVVLFVHESELKVYLEHLGGLLAKLGVGLVAWRGKGPTVGFGISRLAAQQCRSLFFGSRFDVILCDINVAASSSVPKPKKKSTAQNLATPETGYQSDEEDYKSWKSSTTFIYMSSGLGTGIPTLKLNPQTSSLERATYSKGGDGRPIEQLVVVGDDELLYDPCFITSSEDADMTLGVEYELSFLPSTTSQSLTRKSTARIDKVDIGQQGNHTHAYMELRKLYLQSLRHEDAVTIEYYQEGQTRFLTVGELAREIARLYGLDELVIRSLIIEKILLEYKARHLYV